MYGQKSQGHIYRNIKKDIYCNKINMKLYAIIHLLSLDVIHQGQLKEDLRVAIESIILVVLHKFI